MARLTVHDPAEAPAAARPLLEGVRKKLGIVPNLMRVVAASPAALGGYLGFSGALAGDSLPPRLREQIAIAIAETDGCDYCLAAHSFIGGKLGLEPAALEQARDGTAPDAKDAAAIAFARAVLASAGRVEDAALAAVRDAGWDEAAIVEIIAHVAVNLFTNSVNNVARTPVDFPAIAPRHRAA
jgi:uncharacterized peroxidase-related enzyme